MSNYHRITFKERVRIEAGIYARKSFGQIAKELGRSTSSITRKVKQNRTMARTPLLAGKDCVFASQWQISDEVGLMGKRSLCDYDDFRGQ